MAKKKATKKATSRGGVTHIHVHLDKGFNLPHGYETRKAKRKPAKRK